MMPLFDSVVSHATEWPTEIKDLAYLLDSPIPSQLVNDPCPVVSFRAFPVLEELRNSLTESLVQFTKSDTKILDILDLVLSTVRMLRALSNASDNGAGQSTIPFWSLLIRSLAFVCYDKSFAMEEAAFVRPRLSYVRSFMEDGHASLLISHIVEDVQRPKSAVKDEASLGLLSMMTAEHSKKESQEESDSETSYDDESSSETSYERTEVSTDPTSAQSSYVPLDAHILASWHHPNSVVLPFLCVTEEEDIFSLMGGVLYQRSTWGISEPVVGIILSKTGFVARVVLGWLDKECSDPEVLPAIKFAYGDETRTDASLGVYDLTDPIGAVKFSQFILGLRAHVKGIVAQCRTPTFKRLSWRSDSIDDDNSGTEEQWRQRIVNWLDAVAKCIAPSDSSSSHSCSLPMADSEKRLTRSSSNSRPPNRSMSADSKREPYPAEPAGHFVSDVDLVHPQEPSLAAARLENLSDGVSVQSVKYGRQEAQSDGGSSNTGKKRAKSADAVSCSALGARSLAGISPGDRLSFSSYAYDRKIISLSNIPLESNARGKGVNAPEEINEMLRRYEELTSYREPPIEQNESPAVDSGVEEVRDHFLKQINACRCASTQQLSQQLWEVVSGHLSSLLWASVGGYSKRLAGNSPNEAEARHDWDALLNLGFMTANELASGRVLRERAVSLSRNIAADVMQTSPHSDGAEFKAFAIQMHTIAAHHAAYTVNSTIQLRLESSAFVFVTAQHLEDLDDLFSTSEKARKAIFSRSGDEPESGIVDAILTVPLEPTKPVPQSLIRVAETRPTVQASARALSADSIEPEDELAVSEEGVQRCGSSLPGFKSAQSTGSRSQLGPIAEDQPGIGQASQVQPGKTVDRDCLQPFAVTCSKTKSAPPVALTQSVMNVKDVLTKVRLAVLFAEYKKPTQTYAKALVQAKMYLEASVRYLASLGVTKQAVFALATDGVEGAILMAWCPSDSETVYIIERNVRKFNISSPIDVYHFVTVLERLREYGDTTLKTAVEAALKAEDFKQTSWTKTAQFDRMESS
ncbi:hypothetical protein IW262DRAFT_682362 [Armillaria fumosa]|nr:hypothetical protein IW262DRAFT_682362 [Armillaria fumosa]